MIKVILYGRQGCHLCEEARLLLEELQAAVPHYLQVVDIDHDPALLQEYGETIPVVEAGPYKLRAPIGRQDLEITLRAAARREEQLTEIDQAITDGTLKVEIPWRGADRFSYWLARHYLAILNIFVLIYVGAPFLAPVMMQAGATGPAAIVYKVYGAMCHQFAFRSWFLFGEQAAYPRQVADVPDLMSYGQATGLDENDIWTARFYEGDEHIGYKVALCERDVAIYLGIFIFGLLYVVGRKFGLRSIPWYLWFLLAIVPIGLDGVSQLLSQAPFYLIPYRESTPLIRTITGGMFGFFTAWFGYPMVEESMNETVQYMQNRLVRMAANRAQTK